MNGSFWLGVSIIFAGRFGLGLSRGDPNVIGVSVAAMLLGALFFFVGIFPTVKYGIDVLIGLVQLAIISIGGYVVLSQNARDPISAVVEILGLSAISFVVGFLRKIVFRWD